MTLRDELEAKLRSIYVNADSDVFGVIADEVIRQMRWASHITVMSERPGLLTDESIGLAPDGWKP